MKKILITGVAGMIGSHLLDFLSDRRYEIIGIDDLSYGKMENIKASLKKENVEFCRVDVRDYETMKMLCRDADIIVHLAAVKKVSEQQSSMGTLKVNVVGTENILESARMWGWVLSSIWSTWRLSPSCVWSLSW